MYGLRSLSRIIRRVPVYSTIVNTPQSFKFHQTAFVKMVDKEELKKRLTPMQYHVTQEQGTERPFTGCYNKTYDAGTYVCIVCEQTLFSSATKYDSGCGWPAFNDVLDQGKVKLSKDTSTVGGNLLLLVARPGLVRTEVTCSKCHAHLGHVFDDGPAPTRKRFCINSASLNFIADAQPPPADSYSAYGRCCHLAVDNVDSRILFDI